MVKAMRTVGVALSALLLPLAGCELASTVIPRTEPQIVVHAVLDASAEEQYFLIEQSLTGTTPVVDDGPYNPDNPIVSGNGVPVVGAIVTLTDEDGIVMRAGEEAGTGIYHLRHQDYPTRPRLIEGGKRYDLTVSAGGKVVTGSTVVPLAPPRPSIPNVSFNRDQNTLLYTLPDASFSRAFWIRIDAPVEPYSLFTLENKVLVEGDTRNIFTQDLIRVFYPGFLQTVTVAAVDTNVYDYYRSGSDPFSGMGLISHLSGGLGLFGSVSIVDQRNLDVTQDPRGDPVEGRYTLRLSSGGDLTTRATEMTLYLAARGANTKLNPDRISGSYLRQQPPRRAAVYGERTGQTVELQMLVANRTNLVNDVFRGRIAGDSLIGSFDTAAGSAVYVKVGK